MYFCNNKLNLVSVFVFTLHVKSEYCVRNKALNMKPQTIGRLTNIHAPLRRREGILLCCCRSVCRFTSSFRSFFFFLHWLLILKWNLVYRFIKTILRSRFVLRYDRAIFDRVTPLGLWKMPIICSFHSWPGLRTLLVMIRVRIGPLHPLVCRKRRLNGDPWVSG
jgi:hypothetical protein